MESRGATNGAEVNAFAVNEGNFVVDAVGTAQTSLVPTLSLTRRIAAGAVAVVAASGALLLTARRRAVGASQVAIAGSALLVRRVAPKAATTAVLGVGTKLTRRVAAVSSATTTIYGSVLLSWRYLHRASQNRIMRPQPVRAMIVSPELRRFIVPRDLTVMRPPRDRGVMP